MKCPIKLSPSTAEFVKKNGLVYIGVGSPSDALVKGGKIVCESLRVMPDGQAGNGCKMTDHFGGLEDNHYFIRRPDAKKHFPHCLPKARKTPTKLRYFIPAKKYHELVMCYGTHSGAGMGDAYDYSGKRSCDLGNIEGVERHVRDGNWAEVSKTVALARVKPAKTEVETLREENAALKARIAELESEKEKLRAAIKALNNF